MPADVLDRLNLAKSAALEAGEITLRHFRAGVRVEIKEDKSPVTVADREAEQHLRQRIRAAFPDDAIVGEEFGEQHGQSGYRWILDPIDGTKSFIYGVPLYGTLIGIEFDSRSIVGVIGAPATGELVWAAQGNGAWYQRGDQPATRVYVSKCAHLSDALILTSELEGYAIMGRPDVLHALPAACRMIRTWGDAYGYMLVATGRADGMLDPRMHEWDAAAIQPILEEAGGVFTDWTGAATFRGGNGVAANGEIHRELMRLTQGQS